MFVSFLLFQHTRHLYRRAYSGNNARVDSPGSYNNNSYTATNHYHSKLKFEYILGPQYVKPQCLILSLANKTSSVESYLSGCSNDG